MHESEVRRAVDDFYRALNRLFEGDIEPMLDVWSHAEDVTRMGPFGGRQEGWPEVRREFERTAEMTRGGRVGPEDLLIRGDGEMAVVICVERGENTDRQGRTVPVRHRATTVCRREEGGWKVVHHHTDIAPRLEEMARGTSSNVD